MSKPSRYEVKRTGRTWGVFVGPTLIEGGFFARDAAQGEADALAERDEQEERADRRHLRQINGAEDL